MTRAAYAKLYLILATFCLVFSLSVHVLTQGGGSLANLPGLDGKQPVISAYFAVMLTGLTLFAAGVIAILYARSPGDGMAPALPLIGLGDTAANVDARKTSAKVYAGIVLFLFAILPAASLIHLNGVVAQRGRIWNEHLPAVITVPAGCLLPTWWPFGDCKADNHRLAASMVNFDGRLWLAETACDVVWEREMSAPQMASRRTGGGPSISQSEAGARSRISDRDTADLRSAGEAAVPSCDQPRDRSAACADSAGRCRGVVWITHSSQLALLATSVLGWLGAALAGGAFLLGISRIRRRDSTLGPKPEKTL